MGARYLLIASTAVCLFPGNERAYAQTAPGNVQALPPIEVTATKPGVKPGRDRNATRVVRAPPRVPVYPTTPLPGAGIDSDKVPASINTIDANQIKQTESLNISESLVKYVPGITVNEVNGNPFTPDVQFRGFVASPVSGTPQGLAVYQNGVRINEAFGDTVNWDLIPTAAIKSVDVVTNNPAFGLNALGGRRADEGWFQLSRRRNRYHGRLVRAHPEFGAVGQADRQFCRLWCARRGARGRISKFPDIERPALLWRHRRQE
jgi:outer membrane receptor protein involved in Fe transport